MSDDIRPDQDTDIIPGLRPQDTPPMPLDLPTTQGPRHRRRRRDMPMVAQIALWGVPVGGLALIVGWTVPGLLGGDEARPAPPAVSSPSESAEPVAVPSVPLPSPSRVERSRSRTSTPSPSRTSATPPQTSSPSPSPQRTVTRFLPSPSETPSTPVRGKPPGPPPKGNDNDGSDDGTGDSDDGGSSDHGDDAGSNGTGSQGDQP